MNDEIKEILEGIGETSKEQFVPIEFPLTIKECKILLDYITNLQEENDYLKDIVSNTELSDEIKKADKWSKRELYKINFQRLLVNGRLREENENLKDYLKIMEKGKNNNLNRFLDYKSRIDKAIEMLDNDILRNNYYTLDFEFKFMKYREDLLNILKGSDKQ